MKNVLIVSSLILTFVINVTRNEFTIKEYAAIIANSKETFEAHCVYIISSNDPLKDQLRTQSIIKLLSQKQIGIAVVDFDSMDETGKCDVSLSLNVIIGDKTGAKSILSKHAQVPSYATWLVFHDEPLDSFLPELIIPFDVELLLVERLNETTVTFSEVFHIHEDIPINRNLFGTWTPQRGIVRRINGSLRERRSNLHGMVMRAGVRHVSELKPSLL